MTPVTAACLACAILVGAVGCSESDELPTPLPASALVAPPADGSTDSAPDGPNEAAAPDSAPDGTGDDAADDGQTSSPNADGAGLDADSDSGDP
jgi:hypothetical protein